MPDGASISSAAVVTGASRGIGLAIAGELATHYGALALVARSADVLRDAAGTLKGRGCDVHALPADLGKRDDIEMLARRAAGALGRIDVLVHAAGIYRTGFAPADDASNLMRVNYEGPAYLTALLLPLLKKSHGQIVFINSTQGLQAQAHTAAYAASKSALRAFADSLRAEVNAEGVRVLSVFAGATATAIQEHIHEEAGRSYRPEMLLQPSDIASIIAAALRLPRSAEVTDITIRPMRPPRSSSLNKTGAECE